MSNSDSAKIGGTASAVGPNLMKRIKPVQIELKDMIISEKKLYDKVLFNNFAERLKVISFRVEDNYFEKYKNNSSTSMRDRA